MASKRDPTGLRAQLEKLRTISDVRQRPDSFRRKSRMAALRFEQFVIELVMSLDDSIESDSEYKKLFGPELRRNFDLVMPNSILDMKPNILFEIKYFRDYRYMTSIAFRRIQYLIEQTDKMAESCNIGTLVIVSNYDPDQRLQKKFKTLVNKLNNEYVVYEWWGPKKLESILLALGEKGKHLVDSLPIAELGAALRSVASGAGDDWLGNRKQLIQEIQSARTEDDLALFLGAGVSIDAKVPGWGKLLSFLYGELMHKVLPDKTGEIPSEEMIRAVESLLAMQTDSPLMNARAIRSGLQNSFLPTVRKGLYRKVDSEYQPQLEQIAMLCDPLRGRIGIPAVVTYNFDDLLEQQLRKLHIANMSVYDGRQIAKQSELPIYHVHGLIPEIGNIPSEQILIFSEEGYHHAYNQPYTWSNVVQLNLLTQHTCLFIGLSMTDPNLRRLLEIASNTQPRVRHVAILQRAKARSTKHCPLDHDECPLEKPNPMNPTLESSVHAIHHEAWESTLCELGARILWFEDFSEVSEILAEIRET